MNMLRPSDLWTIAHQHHPRASNPPHGDLEPTTTPRATVLGGRRRLAAAALLPVLAVVTSCGSSDPETSAYCRAIEDAKPAFTALETGDPDQFEEAFAAFHELAKDAPSDLDADWKVLDGAITDVESALAAAGLDFVAVLSGDLPDGLDPQALQVVMDGLETLASADVTEAADSIEGHAFEECDVELAAG